MLADLLDLVLPRDCAGCGAPGRTLCPDCRAGLPDRPFPHAPTPPPPGLPPLTAAAAYDGVVRELLLAHKERGRTTLASPLGALLAVAVEGALAVAVPPHGRRPVLVPVPSSPQAVRARGHDHARRLAAAAARSSGLRPAVLLTGARAVGDQSGLDTAGRAANLAGALRSRRRLDGVAVLLVDDVVTTGATLAEAARALRAAGADVVGGAVVAATVLRRRRVTPTGEGLSLAAREV